MKGEKLASQSYLKLFAYPSASLNEDIWYHVWPVNIVTEIIYVAMYLIDLCVSQLIFPDPFLFFSSLAALFS